MFLDTFRVSVMSKLNVAMAGLLLITVFCALAVLAMTSRESLTGFARSLAVKQALLERNKIMALIDKEVALARALAGDPTVVRFAFAEDSDTTRSVALAQLENFRGLLRDKSYFLAVDRTAQYWTFDGQKPEQGLIVTTLNPDNPHDRWFYDTMATVDTYALNLDFDRVFDSIKVWINVIVQGPAGEKLGVGGSGIDISEFFHEVVNLNNQEIMTIIVDRDGNIQLHPDLEIMKHNAIVKSDTDKVKIQAVLASPEDAQNFEKSLSLVASGAVEVESLPLTLDGSVRMAALTALPGLGWYNLVLVDPSNAAGAGIFWPTVTLLILSLLVLAVSVRILLRRMIITPLTALTGASAEIARGNYAHILPVNRNDELGRLSASFNYMAGMVLDHTSNLERKVHERTAELEAAYENLERSQQHMLESLSYARIIQSSILPCAESLNRAFSEHMTLYLPRDIVGGDLYYCSEVPGGYLMGVIDCTGHGVPGAFMSMTAHALLGHIITSICADDPARMLTEMDRLLRVTLGLDSRDGEHRLDCGLEMALCLCLPAESRIVFAGAGISLFILEAGDVRQIPGDRQNIGYLRRRYRKGYTNHVVENASDMTFYITTDGFLDEGGGEMGYCFGMDRFRNLLRLCSASPLAAQAELFKQALSTYRGDRTQRDDVTLVGFRLKKRNLL